MASDLELQKWSNPDLQRCTLCRHGSSCKRAKEGQCGFAHALSETAAPAEHRREYKGMWKDAVDRWYGQDVPPRQRQRIFRVLFDTVPSQRPVWAVAFDWFFRGMSPSTHPELPWDFGLTHACNIMQRCRIKAVIPFKWAVRTELEPYGVWEALDQRKCILSDMEYPELVPFAPSMTARSEARSGSQDEISMDTEGSGVGDRALRAARMMSQPPPPPSSACSQDERPPVEYIE